MTPSGQGRARVALADFVKPSDALSIDLDLANNRILAIAVKTYVEKPEENVGLTVTFGELAGGVLERLPRVYQFVAWSRDNDFVSIKDQLQKEKQAKRQKHLQPKDRVRIVKGVLAGKTGVVQELDGKGGAKVLVGKMVVKVDADDVVRA